MLRKCRATVMSMAAIALLSLGGCANKLPMAVDSGTASLKLDEQSVLLLTVAISRQEESRFNPVPYWLNVGVVDAAGKFAEGKILNLDGDGWLETADQKTLYAFRIPVTQGTTGLRTIYGQAKAFPIVGNFFLPVGMEVPVTKGKIMYLGRLEAVLRPRADHEYRAGAVIPLIDQSVSGLSGGTFDIKLVDRSAEDLPLIRNAYPVLATTPIETRLVPIPDREYLDRQWAGEDMTGVDPYKSSRKSESASVVPAK